MPDLEELIAANRVRVAGRLEGPLMRAIVADYQRVLVAIDEQLRVVTARATAIAADGGDPFSSLVERRRLQALADQVSAEVEAVSSRTGTNIGQAQSIAIVAAIADAQSVMGALELGVRLNTAAVERAAASFLEGMPLARSLDALPVAARQAVRDAVVTGVALGENPRVIARRVSRALGGNMARAMTLARTETLRAYRGAALESYRRSEAVEGWVWVSARDRRTCPVCWAMHGTIHDLDEQFYSHASCRCHPAPLPRTASPRVDTVIMTGEERFAALDAASQRTVLGPAKLAAYQAGQLRLPDLVGERTAGAWGPVRYERSLRDVLGDRALQFYREAA